MFGRYTAHDLKPAADSWSGISSAQLPYRRAKPIVPPAQKKDRQRHVKKIFTPLKMATWFSNRTTPSDSNPGIAEKSSARCPGYISRHIVKTENSMWKKSFKQNLQNSRKNLLHWQTIKEQTWKCTQAPIDCLVCTPLWAEACGKHTLSLEVFTPGFQTAGICPPQPVSASLQFPILIRKSRDNAWLFPIGISDIPYQATG